MSEFEDMMGLMGAIAAGGPSQVLDRTEVGDLIVSTVETTDLGWETAILDAEKAVYPVERYGDDRAAAEEGHARWVKEAPTLVHVTKLGYGTSVPDELCELARKAVPAT